MDEAADSQGLRKPVNVEGDDSKNLSLNFDPISCSIMKADVIPVHPEAAKDDSPNYMKNHIEAIAVEVFSGRSHFNVKKES